MTDRQQLEQVVTEVLDSLAFDLVEMRHGGSKGRPVLDVRIDRRDGEAVTVDDCARASRAVEARVDGEGLLPERHVLEVSSPGVERPLLRVADWRRFTGRQAKVLSPALGGRVEVEIVGVEGEPGAEVAVLRTAKGVDERVPLAEVKEARLAFNW